MYDAIVVGSGPGGASAACHLAEGGLNTLIIEEGDAYSQAQITPFSIDEMEKKYGASKRIHP